MNKIKLHLLGLGLALALFLPACSTIPAGQQAADMATIAQLAAYTGARYDLIDHPDHKPFYVASVAALDLLIKDANYDPVAFANALKALPIKQLSGQKGDLVVGVAVILWDSYAARVISLNKATYVKAVVQATRDGLTLALK